MDNDASLVEVTTTPRTHDRGEITGKPLSDTEKATSEALVHGTIESDPNKDRPESES
jgi:hypothetical protein